MAQIPKSIQNLIEAFERLPGIGPKTAQRLTFYLLHAPKEEAQALASAALDLKEKTVLCSICFNIGEKDPCNICADSSRDPSVIMVVENPLDVLALEKANYKGLYHVLHGVISPLDGISARDLKIAELVQKIEDGISGTKTQIKEIIFAFDADLEGDTTALYLTKILQGKYLKISRIAHGIPMGSDIDFIDDRTMGRALENRVEL